MTPITIPLQTFQSQLDALRSGSADPSKATTEVERAAALVDRVDYAMATTRHHATYEETAAGRVMQLGRPEVSTIGLESPAPTTRLEFDPGGAEIHSYEVSRSVYGLADTSLGPRPVSVDRTLQYFTDDQGCRHYLSDARAVPMQAEGNLVDFARDVIGMAPRESRLEKERAVARDLGNPQHLEVIVDPTNQIVTLLYSDPGP